MSFVNHCHSIPKLQREGTDNNNKSDPTEFQWSKPKEYVGLGTLNIHDDVIKHFPRYWWIPAQRPVTWNFDVFFDLCLNKRVSKAQVTLCRSGGPDLYDLKNRGHRHGRLMKSWQHRTNILEVRTVGKRSAMIGKPARQGFTVKLSRVGRDCGYDLLMDRFQSCVESETSWDCRTQREGIRGQRVGIRGQRMDGCEDRINITIASCLIDVTLRFSYISRNAYISVYICLSFDNMSILMSWSWEYLVDRADEKEPKLQLWQLRVKIIWEEFI